MPLSVGDSDFLRLLSLLQAEDLYRCPTRVRRDSQLSRVLQMRDPMMEKASWQPGVKGSHAGRDERRTDSPHSWGNAGILRSDPDTGCFSRVPYRGCGVSSTDRVWLSGH